MARTIPCAPLHNHKGHYYHGSEHAHTTLQFVAVRAGRPAIMDRRLQYGHADYRHGTGRRESGRNRHDTRDNSHKKQTGYKQYSIQLFQLERDTRYIIKTHGRTKQRHYYNYKHTANRWNRGQQRNISNRRLYYTNKSRGNVPNMVYHQHQRFSPQSRQPHHSPIARIRPRHDVGRPHYNPRRFHYAYQGGKYCAAANGAIAIIAADCGKTASGGRFYANAENRRQRYHARRPNNTGETHGIKHGHCKNTVTKIR